MKHDEATPQPAPLGQVERGVGPHAEVAERHLQAMRDCTRMVQAFGTSMAQAAAWTSSQSAAFAMYIIHSLTLP